MLKLLSFLPTSWTIRLIQQVGLLRNSYTLEVRVIVEDETGGVLLVRHSYLDGWYLPGGGVEREETLAEAARREVFEETGVTATEDPQLLNIYLHTGGTRRDHVGLFHLANWQQAETFLAPNTEIVEARFFSQEELPPGLSKATARRLKEFRAGTLLDSSRW
ncbi:NUDIX domain-containing protein [Labrenzia sp. VG12]|uniref:NUDIX domain-containing protein n=1 Tax=Labrenzia sp. VG12 TaxID=2021862 RepID=UPI000B8C260B|nr:NUDIX domain-containing protein [Labrenzia sp. VG12]ASP34070.1 NUDIX hydrolase [Labrenzia sp. VG12]